MPTGLSSSSGLFPYSKTPKPLDAATVAAIQDALQQACNPPRKISLDAPTRAGLSKLFKDLSDELVAQRKWKPAREVNGELRAICAANEQVQSLLKKASRDAKALLHKAMRSNEPGRLLAAPGHIADAAKRAISNNPDNSTKGRNSYELYKSFIVSLGDMFFESTGKKPTSFSDRKNDGKLGGPFVDFVRVVLAHIPNIPKELSIPGSSLGSVVKTALARPKRRSKKLPLARRN